MKTRKGFTLIELLVTISIIGLLMIVGFVSYQRTNQNARDSRRMADLEQIRQALEMHRSELGRYPTTSGSVQAVNETSAIGDLTPNYMNVLPEDLRNPTTSYRYSATNTTYSLCAHVENADNLTPTTACSSQTCGNIGASNCNYEVRNP